MKEVHFVLQGKGGVGKSFISSMLAQYLMKKHGEHVKCYDTDPVNQTFSQYKALNVETVNILTEHQTIDSSKFDSLIESIINYDGISIIDNGAATFVPLMQYLAENDVINLLLESEIIVITHVPLQGGQAFNDTLNGLSKTLQTESIVIPWLNNHPNKLAYSKESFSHLPMLQSTSKILGVVELPHRNPDTFGKDIQLMTSKSLTFDEVAHSPLFTLMPKQRLKRVKDEIFDQLKDFI